MAALERWEGWKTNRSQKPVIILGERHAVQLGLRQMRRVVPLQVTQLHGLRVPTAHGDPPDQGIPLHGTALCPRFCGCGRAGQAPWRPSRPSAA